jgi:ribokinase
MARIVVVGSINMDLVTVTARFPGAGETLMGERFLTIPGGKGANQAVAAARLGARVSLVGALGRDAFGDQLHAGLQREGIDLKHVKRLDDTQSGTASITVAGGENQIVVVPAANARVTAAQVIDAAAAFDGADAVLLQLEIPLEAVEAAVDVATRAGVPVILNPAPAQRLPAALLKRVRYLTPNQHELAGVLGENPGGDFRALMTRAPCPVVLTRGSEGAWYSDGGEPVHQRGFKVDVVDTTGAGDTFNGAMAVFLDRGIGEAVRLACAAAALSVSRLGAQGGMPSLRETEAFASAVK